MRMMVGAVDQDVGDTLYCCASLAAAGIVFKVDTVGEGILRECGQVGGDEGRLRWSDLWYGARR